MFFCTLYKRDTMCNIVSFRGAYMGFITSDRGRYPVFMLSQAYRLLAVALYLANIWVWYKSSHNQISIFPKCQTIPLTERQTNWRVHCCVGSIVFMPWVCVTAVLFPQHSEYVPLSPIALSVCLKAKLKNRCHWTVGECSEPRLPPQAIHSYT